MLQPIEKLKEGDALFIVDAQNDFFPGGSLAVPEGDKIVPVINLWIHAAQQKHIPIFASRCWHPETHISFKPYGGEWPKHCVQNTPGAKFHPQLNLPEDAIIIDKAFKVDEESYSALGGKTHVDRIEPVEKLRQLNVKRLWICGLALDYCVLNTAIDASKHNFETHVILSGTKAIHTDKIDDTLNRLAEAAVIVEALS